MTTLILDPEQEEALLIGKIRDSLETGHNDLLLSAITEVSDNELRHVFFRLEVEEQDNLLNKLTPDVSARLLGDLPDQEVAKFMERLEPTSAATAISALSSSDQADIIDELGDDTAQEVLLSLSTEQASDIETISRYKDDTAGRLMNPSPVVFHVTETVGDVLKRIADDEEALASVGGEYPCIVDDDGNYVGVLSLRSLLTVKRSIQLKAITKAYESISDAATLDDIQDYFDRNEYAGAPVVNTENRLMGILLEETFAETLSFKQQDDVLKISGVLGDELRSMPLIYRSRKRLAWLSANIVLNIIAASVISAYEETLTAVIALAIFLPMVSDMSGCSGNQAVAVSMREISLGLARPTDAFRVWMKEISVGVINGIILGIIIGFVAFIWKSSPALGLVIGAALAINTMIAVSIGGVVPLLLKRFNVDPAVASGPLLTTITDMAGFFLVLGLATMALPYLI
ncbi:MAG: magnesium transporter [Hyphomonadaceae bacterium]|nr:magnesium transporter [Hyphomonadaceae bacterium]